MTDTIVTYTVFDENTSYSLRQCCALCGISAQTIHEMIDEGVISPVGNSPQNWSFGALEIRRIQITLRLQQDLGVNLPGAALALDLLEELARYRYSSPLNNPQE
ncbi:MAG: chaperone modulator CbpM [Proteobacteria bacterium]|nr:chaperone modulator CbpM [Pseudomonadota bacterium]MBU1650315.1 chaperone modulator CbpM [Pseudomonadota bacterium]MBU1986303.1 chaperone modulator CbpM [Pseudomonadota bacterium]